MSIYLGLGGNQGDRRANIELAIRQLQCRGFVVEQVSPIVETPAMLPVGAQVSWNRPFLNCVVCGNASWSPQQGLAIAKEIELELGRVQGERWAPRPIDIDLLIWHDLELHDAEKNGGSLIIPHYGLADRPFVLTPLTHLQPDLKIPNIGKTVFELSQKVKPVPLWMAIINVTPDSFSDGGAWTDEKALEQYVESLIGSNVQILDLGAESTRPNANPVSAAEEWARLQPVLQMIHDKYNGHIVKPLISIDSRNAQTLRHCLQAGIDIINDVSGLRDPNIIDLVKSSGCQAVAMHSLTIPVNPSIHMSSERNVLRQMDEWLHNKMQQWDSAGLDLNKIIFDPGIGFNKNSLQSTELLQNCGTLRQAGMRILVGHSRKSFMSGFTGEGFADRDLETLGVSLSLCQQGVDVIRVHDPISHVRAYRAWSHIHRNS